MMKKILGLDLGTNSVGWALVTVDDGQQYQPQIKTGSRIIPMSQDVISDFDKGVTQSQTAERTRYRGIRRLRERVLQRRERLLRVLHVLGFLPAHFDEKIGWDASDNKTFGKFMDASEPKVAWCCVEGKMQFLFMESFHQMIADFMEHQPQLLSDGRKVPMDWTLYYLRKKALTAPVSREELAWILLSFNQKRGYYQLRGEEEEEVNPRKKEEYYRLRVVKVEATDEKKGKDIWYNIHLENGWIYRRSSRYPLDDWMGQQKEFIVTTDLNEDGTEKVDKEGNVKRSFRAPKEDDWTLVKRRTEMLLEESKATVGAYIYDNLLAHPSEKIRGGLVRTIERKFYRQELEAILRKQLEYLPELSSEECLKACVHELYKHNENHRASLLNRGDMVYLLVQDLIFYQRPLKSKKSLIADCPLERYEIVDRETGEVNSKPIKCVAKSNPYFQEFRIWQFMQNLRLYNNDNFERDVTGTYLASSRDYDRLFDFLNNRPSITQDQFMKDFLNLKKKKADKQPFPIRWNYIEDKEYVCNETRATMLKALKEAGLDSTVIGDRAEEYRLWHLLYSVEDKQEITRALEAYAKRRELPESFVKSFQKVRPFKKEYGSYSEKAIKRLLTLMRQGTYWSAECIDLKTKKRIQAILEGEVDPTIASRMGAALGKFHQVEDFQMLPVWLSSYIIYNRHSEVEDTGKWQSPEEMMSFIRGFKQHSMRNPIVEQCVLETLRTVHDIWKQEGHIDEIHVELGRSMKSTSEERKRMTDSITQNENTNLRIKHLLMELKNDKDISNVRPFSPSQQDILRIYEEGALQNLKPSDADYEEISRISRLREPSSTELQRYKLWLDQKYCSPYTGKPISLSKLFTPAYQIEHIIPKARFFDDSFSNKVICEAEVNALKTNLLAYEFIGKRGGEVVTCSALGNVTILSPAEYEQFVSDHFQGKKKKNLLMDDIPTEFVQRQMNDTRYISRTIIALLSQVVREEDEQESTSKNVIPCTGGITDRLKKDWGLNDVWNHIVYPRFERMNQLSGTDDYGHWESKDGKWVFQTSMPLELQAGFNKKRIDHRHHAMDALVIACASRQIISYLNNESAKDTKRREDLRRKLCGKNQLLYKPWETFTQDARDALMNIVVSFKNYVRVINKASNHYVHFNEEGIRETVCQKSAEQWAIRKPLHKETIYGHVNLRRIEEVPFNKALEVAGNIVDRELRKEIKAMLQSGMSSKKIATHFKDILYQFRGKDVKKVSVYYTTDEKTPMVATRKSLDASFDKKRIESITDTGIQKILLNYLAEKGGDPKIAFTPEGIAQMNENIYQYNDGKPHHPILKVRVTEVMGEKFQVGERGVNSHKYVVAEKGTNLYFAIYVDEEGKRYYQTIPLSELIERLKQKLTPVPEQDEKDHRLLFYLSPNDLVYVPTEDEALQPVMNPHKLSVERIYKMVSSADYQCFFIQSHVAKSLVDKIEFYSKNKMERALDGQMVKAVCWKLEVDRLGNIIKIIR